jgi:ABC-type Zn uptake system ZnuABC Zn-binding protein ZnuA
MRLRSLFASTILVAALATAAACTGDDDDPGDDALHVLASNGIVADWVASVAGERVEVDALIPAGADLHSFQLSPSAVRAIGDADLVLLVGAALEANFEGTVRENASGPVIELAEGLDLREFEEHEDEHEDQDEEDEHGHGAEDPHIWMDADLAIAAVDRIAEELSALDPANVDDYRANARDYADEIREMDATIAATLSGLPAKQKLLVTFHDAYGYFADRYGLTILGFVVENADEEPSAATIADLITDMREAGAAAIYVEPQFSARVVQQVAAETGAEVRTIPSDALTTGYPTYIALMEAIAEGIAS